MDEESHHFYRPVWRPENDADDSLHGWHYRGHTDLARWLATKPALEEFLVGWTPPSRADAARLIPRILHQSWKVGLPPKKLRSYVASWQERQPDWKYKLHTDLANGELVAGRYPWLATLFLSLSGIQRADVSRLLYMHAYGGVYADLDVELLQPIQPLFDRLCATSNSSAIIGQEPLAHSVLLESKPRQVCNAVLVSARGHPFWLWALQQIISSFDSNPDSDPVGSTGPRMLEGLVLRWQAVHARTSGGLMVAAPETFFPSWDPMQEEAFINHCKDVAARERERNATAAARLEPDGLLATAHQVCQVLARDGFKPTVPTDGSAFTDHHWVHTWFDETPDVDIWAMGWGGEQQRITEMLRAAVSSNAPPSPPAKAVAGAAPARVAPAGRFFKGGSLAPLPLPHATNVSDAASRARAQGLTGLRYGMQFTRDQLTVGKAAIGKAAAVAAAHAQPVGAMSGSRGGLRTVPDGSGRLASGFYARYSR